MVVGDRRRRREGRVDEADDPGLFDAAVLGSGGGPPGDLGVAFTRGLPSSSAVERPVVTANDVRLPRMPEQALD